LAVCSSVPQVTNYAFINNEKHDSLYTKVSSCLELMESASLSYLCALNELDEHDVRKIILKIAKKNGLINILYY
jgi:hypothetical protein